MTMLDHARAAILTPAGLDESLLRRALERAAASGADLADVFLERATTVRWRLENGRVTGGGFGVEQGVGVRVAHGSEVSFAHSADQRAPALFDAAGAAATMARHGDGVRLPGGIALTASMPNHDLYSLSDPTDGDGAAWLALLVQVDALARAADPRIMRVDAGVMVSRQAMLVADLDGRIAGDVRPLSRLSVTVVVEAGDRRASGHAALGGRHGCEGFEAAAVEIIVRRAVRIACVNLEARPAPSGTMPVVLAPGYPGVLFHEAVGHGLEADHHRKRQSIFAGRIGERVAAPGVTVIDDGGIAGRAGSLALDDEGISADRTVLIDDGILVGLMYDRLNAGLMNARSTGNGRRQSYAHLPMPRMTNTFLAPGTADPDEIVSSVKSGIYAVGFGGGQVDITSGRFNFTTTEAYLIENGRVTAPIDGATLIGVGDEVLRHVDMIGHDLALDDGEAGCGKNGQWIDVCVGQPTLRVGSMMVGGRGPAA